jgi:deoxyribodipyrimidine photo-lyase
VTVPAIRITALNDGAPRPDGSFVLYWMTANRRATHNFALDRAVELAASHNVPVVVLEALRAGYPWASERLHAFVIQGMADNARAFAGTPAHYYPYVEPSADAGKGLVEALAARAVAVVTDEFPCFFLPRMAASVAKRIAVRVEQVDSNGLLPLRATDKAHVTAYAFRRMLQKAVLPHLEEIPRSAPFEGFAPKRLASLPKEITARWPAANLESLDRNGITTLPIDHTVGAVGTAGGTTAARAAWQRFLSQNLLRYAADRSHPDDGVASGLSPWLHFGHISTHELFDSLAEWQDWSPEKIGVRAAGQREGFWNMGPDADSFLDELITWRELGYGTCLFEPRYAEYGSLPNWARATLDKHRGRQAGMGLFARTTRKRRDPRRSVERGPAGTRAGRPHAELPAHALGQEDPRVVALAGTRP